MTEELKKFLEKQRTMHKIAMCLPKLKLTEENKEEGIRIASKIVQDVEDELERILIDNRDNESKGKGKGINEET